LLRLSAAGDNAAMQTEPPKADPPKRKRRWFQFSLRSLLIFTLICAIASAWLGREIERKRKEREAVAAIVKLGGRARYDYQLLDAKPTGPNWLRMLLGENSLNEVAEVDLVGAGSADDGLENVKGLMQLYVAYLDRTNVTDAGLRNLAGLTQLEVLYLDEIEVTDAGLCHLSRLIRLRDLRLCETNITDAGLRNLKGLTQLQDLYLNETKVGDAGLTGLKGLTQLELLDVNGTNVSDAGMKELRKALPNCTIYH
jgi:hypothetical protein